MNLYVLDKEHNAKLREYIENVRNVLLAQHTLEWRDALLEMKTDEAYYVVAETNNNIVGYMPLYLFKSTLGNILQSSPYAASYGGIVTDLCGENKEMLFDAIFEFIWNDKNLMEGTILFTVVTPPYSCDLDLYKRYFRFDSIHKNFYQFLDLQSELEKSQTSKFRNNLNRNLRKARENDLVVRISRDASDLDIWYNIIKSRLADIGTSPAHLEYYSALTKHLFKARMGKFVHIVKGSEIIASGLFFHCKKTADVFLRAVKTQFMETQAGTFLDYHAISYFKNKGYKYFNWQSCPKRDYGIFHYKAGWGSQVESHYYLTKRVNGFNAFYANSLSDVTQAYPYHYILPYEEIKYAKHQL